MVFVSRRMSSKKLYLKLSLLGKEVILAQSVKEFDSTSTHNHISTIQCHSLACPKLSEIDLFSVGVFLKLLLTRVFPVLVTPINDWQCGHPLLYSLFVSYNTFKTLPRESFAVWRSMTPFLPSCTLAFLQSWTLFILALYLSIIIFQYCFTFIRPFPLQTEFG